MNERSFYQRLAERTCALIGHHWKWFKSSADGTQRSSWFDFERCTRCGLEGRTLQDGTHYSMPKRGRPGRGRVPITYAD